MTQISAILTIPAEQESLLTEVLHEMAQLRAALHQEDILTEEEAAGVLKVSVSTLRSWRRKDDGCPTSARGRRSSLSGGRCWRRISGILERRHILTCYRDDND